MNTLKQEAKGMNKIIDSRARIIEQKRAFVEEKDFSVKRGTK